MRRFPNLLLKQFPKEFSVFKKLDSPAKVQDFLNTLRFNFEPHGDTCRSPLMALRTGAAHCIEGALLAAAVLWYHGCQPLLLDLKTTNDDFEHVVAVFKNSAGRNSIGGRGARWGAISKTNHAVLRYRDPIYRDPRELAMSYFNEYFLDSGVKTLRAYSSKPFDISRFGDEWLTSREDLWEIHDALDEAPHTKILDKRMIKNLRRADPIEIKAGKIVGQEKR